jgi:hypothetical protein
MADLKRKQLKEFLSGSFGITGSLNVTGSVEFDKNISGSITSTGSFSRLVGDTISVTNSPYASGSTVQTLMDATGSYASSSTTYVKESQTGSFGSGSDVQGLLDTYVRQSESSSFASGSDLQPILAESSSYVVESETGSFASGSDLHQFLAESASYVTSISTGSLNVMLAESASYVVSTNTGSYASGSDLHQFLAESSSYVMSTNTSSFLQNTDTASFSTLHVVGNITTSGSVTAQQFYTEVVSSSIIYESGSTQFGDSLDDTHRITGSLQITGSSLTIDNVGGVSGSITSTGSFGKLELVDSVHISPFASGSDLHTILAQSASYVTLDETGSFASGSDLHTILAESASYVVSTNTGSYASGSDLHQFLAESASYLVADTSMSFVNVSSSITSTGSFGRVDVADNTFILGSLGIGTSTQGNRLQVAGDATIVGALDTLNSVSGGLSSTGSFGYVEALGVKLLNSNQTASFASGSDLHTILAQSASYMMSDQTGSMGATSISSTLSVVGDIATSGSVIAREFKTEFVSSSIIFASGSQIFGDSEDDTHSFSGSVNIGDMVLSGSRVGVSSDLNLLTLSDNTLTINGSIVIDDGANIGIDADPNLLDLNDQNLIVNGILDSTGRIDAQSGLQVSGSSLQVGNDLTLNYTSPVSHSLMFVNYTNKTVDLLPVASSSGQLAQFNGTTWIISDEIDGGSF